MNELINFENHRFSLNSIGRCGGLVRATNENIPTVGYVTAINIGDEHADDQNDQDIVYKAKDAKSGFRYDVERRKQVNHTDQQEKAEPEAIQI